MQLLFLFSFWLKGSHEFIYLCKVLDLLYDDKQFISLIFGESLRLTVTMDHSALLSNITIMDERQ